MTANFAQQACKLFALVRREWGKQRGNPPAVLRNQCAGQRAPGGGEFDDQCTAVVLVCLALDKCFALQPVKQAGDAGAGNACLFCKRMGGERAASSLQQKEQHKAPLGEAMRGQQRAAIAVYGGSQREGLETQLHALHIRIGQLAYLGLRQQGLVFAIEFKLLHFCKLFDCMAANYMRVGKQKTCKALGACRSVL